MLVLGISGGADHVFENRDFLYPYGEVHDSAAALVEDGKIIAAIEEERLNRIKHTNKGPISALRFCLDRYGVRLSDVDKLVVAADEQVVAKVVRFRDYRRPEGEPLKDPRGLVQELLTRATEERIDDDKITFVHHHIAHAVSAYSLSGYDRGLVLTMDGGGDDVAGTVLNGEGSSLELLSRTPMSKSLGLFYLNVVGFLGYSLFDEYKVMGLAPYGNPEKYRSLFRSFYELLPDGDYVLKMDLPDALAGVTPPRKKKAPFLQVHKDIAAALQESLEEIVFHVLRHYKAQTGQRNLCLSGGVAHNCTLNGKLLYSGMFDRVFVQPAAHDGGLALGAAIYPFLGGSSGAAPSSRRLEHVFFGRDIESAERIEEILTGWNRLIDFERFDDIVDSTARLLAGGAVVGWVQGPSEFGPRALGNRSIIADPRPAENKDIINAMVKKREAYRPFAPSVLEEQAAEFFDLPPIENDFSFMTYVVKVRKEKQHLLRATTHVDGTARIQTVSKKTNGKYWSLIDAFGKITGVPVLLNTSFNNNAEPIVDSATDAIVTFLTTKLNYLVVGDYLVTKKQAERDAYLALIPSLPLYAKLVKTQKYVSVDELGTSFEIGSTVHSKYDVRISPKIYLLLSRAGGNKSFGELLAESQIADENDRGAVIDEMIELWSRRAITLAPRVADRDADPSISPA
jgi:carbamoyltransferase